MVFVLLGFLAVIGVGQVPVVPPRMAPLPPEIWLTLDLSQATFTRPPGAPEEAGAWFIPVKGVSDILNAPPAKDTVIGIVIAGPKLGIVYFRVERGIAWITIVIPFEPDIGDWARARARWIPMRPGVAGEIRFDLVYPGLPALAKKPWWWPSDIEFGHKPDCTWYGKISW